MAGRPKNVELERRVYALLVEGKTQASVAAILKVAKSTVHSCTGRLVAKGYLLAVKGATREKLYTKGPKAGELDAVFLEFSDEVYARGVTPPPIFGQSSTPVSDGKKTARVHHGCLKMNVVVEGDVEAILEVIPPRYFGPETLNPAGVRDRTIRRPFLRKYQDRRGVERFTGQLAYHDEWVTVGYERSAKRKTFYIYPPQLDLTADELESYETRWISISMELSNYLQKNAGWQFGIPELTNWQTHIGIDCPALMDGISDKLFMESEDRQTWTSNSEGRSEIETSSIDRARVILEMPRNIVQLETNVAGLYRVLELLTASVTKMAESTGQLARVNELTLGREVLAAISRLDAQLSELKTGQPAAPDKAGADKEVMYG
ncbi:MAG: hypothetical protein PHV99_03760 [Candidatus Pacebacteria bacterium]|nr:hypothetical protein [Candidatus Paceibacterota bacterium]